MSTAKEKGGAFALVVWAVGAGGAKDPAASDCPGAAVVEEGVAVELGKAEAAGCKPSSNPANKDNGPSVALGPTPATAATGAAPDVAVVNTDAGTTKVCIQRIEWARKAAQGAIPPKQQPRQSELSS